MLREWATDITAGKAGVDFEEIQDLFDILQVEFGPDPPPVSINTALRAALSSADAGKLGAEDTFDALTIIFETLFDPFGGGPVSIGSVAAEFAARYTFGNATQFGFEFIGADYDFIQMTFDGGNATGVLISFDRESRRFEMVN